MKADAGGREVAGLGITIELGDVSMQLVGWTGK